MRTRLRVLVSLAAVVLVVTACSDDDTETTTTTDGVTTASTTTTTATPQMDATTTTTGDTDVEDSMNETSELMARYEQAPLRTTYVFFEDSSASQVTVSRDPTADPTVEAVIVPEANAKLITIGENAIFCDTTAEECFEVADVGAGFTAALPGPFVARLLIAGELDKIPDATMTDETVEVAGRRGVCLTFSSPADMDFDTEFVRHCIDAELGFTLLVETQTADAETVELLVKLIDFGEPQPGDFEPSGPVTAGP